MSFPDRDKWAEADSNSKRGLTGPRGSPGLGTRQGTELNSYKRVKVALLLVPQKTRQPVSSVWALAGGPASQTPLRPLLALVVSLFLSGHFSYLIEPKLLKRNFLRTVHILLGISFL